LSGTSKQNDTRTTDDTALMDLEAEVARRTADLKAAVEELEAFTYTVSHDLRAPLRAIDGFSRILVEDHRDELSDEAREYLDLIRESARDMGVLIDDLLDFSRLNRKPLHKQSIDMRALVDEIAESFRRLDQDRVVELTVGDLPPCPADPVLIKTVLTNLVDNAFKYSRSRNPVRIEIGSMRQGPGIVYFVKDNGVGFDMRYADKLFGVFQRLHRAEDFEGTGVGLATVQRSVHRHGGEVWAEGAPNAGATFYFSLPE